MQAGQLRKRVQLQQRSSSQDDYGQQLTSWTTLFTAWASVEPVSGAQLERARSIYNETSHKVTLRWRAQLNDIRQVGSYRVLYAGRIFDVGASMNQDERNRTVVLLCNEGINEGG
jgi:SPP1 family predicted phage head-tail adaptor